MTRPASSSSARSVPGRVRRWRRRLLGHRRLLAAVAAAIAVGATVRSLAPPPAAVPEPPPPLSLGATLAAGHPGLTSLPVRFPDAGMAALLRPGDRVTLLATSTSGVADVSGHSASAGEESATVSRDALVLALPPEPAAGATGGLGTSAGRLVVLGLDPAEADTVAAAAVRSVLTFSWGR